MARYAIISGTNTFIEDDNARAEYDTFAAAMADAEANILAKPADTYLIVKIVAEVSGNISTTAVMVED